MPRMSMGQAKNTVRRALRAVIDREPTDKEISRIWEYFESSCAYCGEKQERNARTGHLDHLLHNGPNHFSNRVLSCAFCNGDAKRDQNWIEFLKWRVADPVTFEQRKMKIEKWVSENLQSAPEQDKSGIVEREIAAVMETIEAAAQRLRAYRDEKRSTRA